LAGRCPVGFDLLVCAPVECCRPDESLNERFDDVTPFTLSGYSRSRVDSWSPAAGAIWGFTRPFERISRFQRFDFILNSRKSAYFGNRVKSDSRRLHQTSLAVGELRLERKNSTIAAGRQETLRAEVL
jgi:hypothetical protein